MSTHTPLPGQAERVSAVHSQPALKQSKKTTGIRKGNTELNKQVFQNTAQTTAVLSSCAAWSHTVCTFHLTMERKVLVSLQTSVPLNSFTFIALVGMRGILFHTHTRKPKQT